jgi:hypothetical protein
MRRLRLRRAVCLAAVFALAAALAGCAADGTSNGDVTFARDGVPFTFQVPADFTAESVDAENSRGSVVAVRALDKVNVVAVRRVTTPPTGTPKRLRVLGKPVTSRVYPVDGQPGWALECQYTDDRGAEVVDACDEARRTVKARQLSAP